MSETLVHADLYEKQAAFYEAQAIEESHIAKAAAYFRREAARVRNTLANRPASDHGKDGR